MCIHTTHDDLAKKTSTVNLQSRVPLRAQRECFCLSESDSEGRADGLTDNKRVFHDHELLYVRGERNLTAALAQRC